MDDIARVEKTMAGPWLYVCGVLTRQWFGTMYDKSATDLCASINAAHRLQSIKGTQP